MPKARLSILGVLLAFPLLGHAQFYSFEENSKSYWEDPAETLTQAAKNTVELLKWTFNQNPRPVPTEKYDRLKQFGTWVDNANDDTCYDTRTLVLIRDSETDVKFSAGNNCKAASGRWTDPYSGNVLTKANPDMEIDHVVALKNAYDSGAYSWDYKHRCLYANFLGDKNHLISASMVENRMKGAKAPDGWMPSNQEFSCQHLQNWLVIKYVWNLNMTQSETRAIDEEIQKNHCDAKAFNFSRNEISRIRNFINNNLTLCRAQEF